MFISDSKTIVQIASLHPQIDSQELFLVTPNHHFVLRTVVHPIFFVPEVKNITWFAFQGKIAPTQGQPKMEWIEMVKYYCHNSLVQYRDLQPQLKTIKFESVSTLTCQASQKWPL